MSRSHVAAGSDHVLAVRADTDGVSVGRREHSDVLVRHERAAVGALRHTRWGIPVGISYAVAMGEKSECSTPPDSVSAARRTPHRSGLRVAQGDHGSGFGQGRPRLPRTSRPNPSCSRDRPGSNWTCWTEEPSHTPRGAPVDRNRRCSRRPLTLDSAARGIRTIHTAVVGCEWRSPEGVSVHRAGPTMPAPTLPSANPRHDGPT